MHYFQFNVGDYASHTRHLSLFEDLAYRRLLDEYYLHERPLNTGIASVSRQIGMREYESEVQFVLESFFQFSEQGWVNKRADEEIAKYREMIDAGKRGAAKRWKNHADGEANTPPISPPMPNSKQETITNNQGLSVPNGTECPPDGELDEKKGRKEKKLPGCDHKGVIELYHLYLPTLRKVEVWNELRENLLRTRWREVASELQDLAEGKPVTREEVLNWWSTFFKHIAKSKFLVGKVSDKDGRSFAADLEWIVRPSNFAKIIEGKYHGSN